MKKNILCAFFLIILVMTGCSKESTIKTAKSLRIDFKNVPSIENASYELHLVKGEQRYPLKKFQVVDGKPVELRNDKKIKVFQTERNILDFDAIEITIEPTKKKKGERSLLLSGEINSNGQDITLKFAGINLEGIEGQYMLATPTDEIAENEESGVWFAKIEGEKMVPGLKIRPTQAGWSYEGWIEYKGKITSLGRFGQPYGKDTIDTYSLRIFQPEIPGEDFIARVPNNFPILVNLATGDYKVSVSLEPDIDGNDPSDVNKPFFIILSSNIPNDLATKTPTPLEVMKDVPEATVTLEID
ncbi:hypothetical protein HYV57_04290 [Candidatus Peregrinibacteria bacterium]|nr:hypothetical protein [Candidatus Peregrinibacteria bacterium]